MEESQPSERKSHSALMARIQKLRTRMYIEAVLGVPATSEDLFLPICLRYEQLEPPFTNQKHAAHSEASEKPSADWDDWTDFGDWDKYANRVDFGGFCDGPDWTDWEKWTNSHNNI